MTEPTAAPEIVPCDGDFDGRFLYEMCHDCGHALAVHRRDRVCSVCQAVAQLRAEMRGDLEH